MDDQKQQIKIFGFGLALMIPFFIAIKTASVRPSVMMFLILFFSILAVINFALTYRLIYHAVLIGCYLIILSQNTIQVLSKTSLLFLCLSLAIYGLTVLRAEFLKGLYHVWMRGAQAIGQIFSTLVLTLIFYGLFTPVSLLLKLTRKDLLDQAFDKSRDSYWIPCERKDFERDYYQRQF